MTPRPDIESKSSVSLAMLRNPSGSRILVLHSSGVAAICLIVAVAFVCVALAWS